MSDEQDPKQVGEEGQEATYASQKRLVLEAVGAMPAELRSEIIDDLLESYCSVCAEHLDTEGECPEGCDPEDLLEEEDDEEEDEEDDEEEEDETPDPPEETGPAQ